MENSNEKIKKIAKELCDKSPCHHKCPDTDKCIVEDEAKELFKQALVEGLNRRFDKTIEEAKKIEQIEEMARDICGYCTVGGVCILDSKKCDLNCSHRDIAEKFYNAGYRKQKQEEKTYD
jgi:hypothetical protein